MKRSFLFLLILASLVLSLSACGGSTAQDDAAAPPAAGASGEESAGELPTLEELFSSDTMQALVEAAIDQYEIEGITANMYAVGDELRYEFTVNDLEATEEDQAFFAQTLQASVDANADSYLETAAQMKGAVSNDTVVVVVTFLDGAGSELFSQSFSSDDAA